MSLALQRVAMVGELIRREGVARDWIRRDMVVDGLDQRAGDPIPTTAHAYPTREQSEVEGVASGLQVYRVDRRPFGDADATIRAARPQTVDLDGVECQIAAWIVRPTHVIAHVRTGGADDG